MTTKIRKRSSIEGVQSHGKAGETPGSVEIQSKKPKLEKGSLPNGKSKNLVKDKKKFETATNRKNRKIARKAKGQYKIHNISVPVGALKEKIKLIEAKDSLTKTARRKLAVYKKKLAIEMGVVKADKEQLVQDKKKNVGQTKKPGSMIRIQANQKLNKGESLAAKKAKKEENIDQQEKKNKINVKQEVDDEEDDDDDDIDEIDLAGDDSGDTEEESDSEEEEDDDNSEPDGDVSASTPKKGQGKNETKTTKQEPKKKRYVLFVGNVDYGTTVDELKTHFLTKVSAVENVRIPQTAGTNQPRGFAYVELTNDIDYEKALSLHHSFLRGRRINVQYTTGDSKPAGHKSQIVAKNQKLHALRQAGKLAGSSPRGGGKIWPMVGRPKPWQKKT